MQDREPNFSSLMFLQKRRGLLIFEFQWSCISTLVKKTSDEYDKSNSSNSHEMQDGNRFYTLGGTAKNSEMIVVAVVVYIRLVHDVIVQQSKIPDRHNFRTGDLVT